MILRHIFSYKLILIFALGFFVLNAPFAQAQGLNTTPSGNNDPEPRMPSDAGFLCVPLFCMGQNCASCLAERREHQRTRNYLQDFIAWHFRRNKNDFILEYVPDNLRTGALQKFAEQLSAVELKAGAEIPAAAADAAALNRTARRIQKVQAEEVHELGTQAGNTCTLTSGILDGPANQRSAVAAANQVNDIGGNRLSGSIGTAGASGPTSDAEARLKITRKNYMPAAAYQRLGGEIEDGTPKDDKNYNADISPETLLGDWTLSNVNFSDSESTAEETAVLALKYNLYGNELPARMAPAAITDITRLDERHDLYSLEALMNVANYSFDSIVATRQEGWGESGEAYKAILEQLGITDPLVQANYLGDDNTPSIMATFKILSAYAASPIGQTQGISTNTRASTSLAMQKVIGLMIKFEMYKSLKRQTYNILGTHEIMRREIQEKWENAPDRARVTRG